MTTAEAWWQLLSLRWASEAVEVQEPACLPYRTSHPIPAWCSSRGAYIAQMLIGALGLTMGMTINHLYHVDQSQWGQG